MGEVLPSWLALAILIFVLVHNKLQIDKKTQQGNLPVMYSRLYQKYKFLMYHREGGGGVLFKRNRCELKEKSEIC